MPTTAGCSSSSLLSAGPATISSSSSSSHTVTSSSMYVPTTSPSSSTFDIHASPGEIDFDYEQPGSLFELIEEYVDAEPGKPAAPTAPQATLPVEPAMAPLRSAAPQSPAASMGHAARTNGGTKRKRARNNRRPNRGQEQHLPKRLRTQRTATGPILPAPDHAMQVNPIMPAQLIPPAPPMHVPMESGIEWPPLLYGESSCFYN